MKGCIRREEEEEEATLVEAENQILDCQGTTVY